MYPNIQNTTQGRNSANLSVNWARPYATLRLFLSINHYLSASDTSREVSRAI